MLRQRWRRTTENGPQNAYRQEDLRALGNHLPLLTGEILLGRHVESSHTNN
jgi:hypothetical protein